MLTALVLMALAGTPSDSKGLLGTSWGMSKKDVLASASPCPGVTAASVTCNVPVAANAAHVEFVFEGTKGDRLVGIYVKFDPAPGEPVEADGTRKRWHEDPKASKGFAVHYADDFLDLRRKLTEKYGKPSETPTKMASADLTDERAIADRLLDGGSISDVWDLKSTQITLLVRGEENFNRQGLLLDYVDQKKVVADNKVRDDASGL